MAVLRRRLFLGSRLERVEDLNIETSKVILVPGGDNQTVYKSCGSYHCLFKQIVGLVMNQPAPLAEARDVHGKNLERVFNSTSPAFDFISLFRILSSGPFNSYLKFAYGSCGKKTLILS